MPFGTYLITKLLNHAFKNASFTQPTHLYVGLSTTDPGVDGSGITEPAGDGYARVEFDDWADEDTGAVENASDIEFPTATATWGTVTHFFIADASTSGNFFGGNALSSSVEIIEDNVPKFLAGDLSVTLS